MAKKRRSGTVIQYASVLATRDGGWFCHYCGIALIPTDAQYGDAPYYIRVVRNSFLGVDEYWNEIYGDRESIQIVEGYRRTAVDHKLAFARGGTNDLKNLVLACSKCNSKKRDKEYNVFIEYIKELAR